MDPATAPDDLSAIRRLMEESQRGVYESGRHYVLWGLTIAAGLGATYLALQSAPRAIPWIWGACLGVGWVVSMWLGMRDAARAPVDSLIGRTVAGIWIGCAVSLTLLAVLGPYTGAIRSAALPAVIAAVLGSGYFASSFAYRNAAVRWLAAAWWLGAIGLFLRPGPGALLVLAAMLVAFQVIPGLVFYRRARRQAGAAVP